MVVLKAYLVCIPSTAVTRTLFVMTLLLLLIPDTWSCKTLAATAPAIIVATSTGPPCTAAAIPIALLLPVTDWLLVYRWNHACFSMTCSLCIVCCGWCLIRIHVSSSTVARGCTIAIIAKVQLHTRRRTIASAPQVPPNRTTATTRLRLQTASQLLITTSARSKAVPLSM